MSKEGNNHNEYAEPDLLVATDPKDRWRTLGSSKIFLFWSFFAFMSVIVVGFDTSIQGQVLAMPAFNKQFGYLFEGAYVTPALWQGLWNGCSALAQCVGALVSSPVSNIWGRKCCYIGSSLICMGGIAIQFASRGWQLMCVGKVINGFGLGGTMTFAPLYVGENSFPELRGFYLVFLVSAIVYGQLSLAITARWSELLVGNASWLVPIGMQWLFPVIAFVLMPFFPESPYWLMVKKNDKKRALKALNILYGKRNQHLVIRRFRELELEANAAIELSKSGREVSWKDCFRGSNRARTWLTFFVCSTQQICGTSFIFGYIGYFSELIGDANPFNTSIIVFVLAFAGNTLSFYTIERFGRRTLINWGLFSMWFLYFIIGGLGFTQTSNKQAVTAVTAFLYLFAFFYETTLAPAGLAYSSEISDMSLRAYTQPLVTIGNSGVGWIFGFISPYLVNPDEAALGAKVGLIFGGLAVLCHIWAYFCVPETNMLTYAELTHLFESKCSYRRFPQEAERYRSELAQHGKTIEVGKSEERIIQAEA